MREIKFRAWDEYQNKLEYFEFPIDAESIAEYNSTKLPTHKRVWMQFTGLFDRNGKEIYEGDVVQVFYDGHPQEAGHEAYTVVIEDMVKSQFGGVGNGNGEVIGNIYENPELLCQTHVCNVKDMESKADWLRSEIEKESKIPSELRKESRRAKLKITKEHSIYGYDVWRGHYEGASISSGGFQNIHETMQSIREVADRLLDEGWEEVYEKV